ncbi:MAG: hypothetical protein QOJ15_4765 [Bradyrhizobium sp.]|jgi:hypothetical protein|nr:hypothetical protein [Bradyrhizobium sp.]
MRATWAGCHDDRRPRIDPPAEDDPQKKSAAPALMHGRVRSFLDTVSLAPSWRRPWAFVSWSCRKLERYCQQQREANHGAADGVYRRNDKSLAPTSGDSPAFEFTHAHCVQSLTVKRPPLQRFRASAPAPQASQCRKDQERYCDGRMHLSIDRV